jgi:hypothetical protein
MLPKNSIAVNVMGIITFFRFFNNVQDKENKETSNPIAVNVLGISLC